MYVRARIGAYGTTAVFSKEKAGGVQEEVSFSGSMLGCWVAFVLTVIVLLCRSSEASKRNTTIESHRGVHIIAATLTKVTKSNTPSCHQDYFLHRLEVSRNYRFRHASLNTPANLSPSV